jgi:hypothetical protein
MEAPEALQPSMSNMPAWHAFLVNTVFNQELAKQTKAYYQQRSQNKIKLLFLFGDCGGLPCQYMPIAQYVLTAVVWLATSIIIVVSLALVILGLIQLDASFLGHDWRKKCWT